MGEEWLSQFPLRAEGRHIVNRNGERFKFAGVNWYGASDTYHVVGGLDMRPLQDICDAVAAMGFTVVRLPFSSQMLRTAAVPPGAINYDLNPDLRGLSPLEVYDRVIAALGKACVAVVMNNHTTLAMWSGGADANGLWFQEGCCEYTEMQWIADWLDLAQRYKDQPHVVGYDLRNEVRPTRYVSGVSGTGPSWGGGGEKDWCRAAGNCSRALLAKPGLEGLLIIERICWPQQGLREMLQPVPPWEVWQVPRDRVVLALHMYAWSGPGNWSPKAFTGHVVRAFFHAMDYMNSRALYGELRDDELEQQMDGEFGFCLDEQICPVWLSEFGADLRNPYEHEWFERLCRYLERKDVDFAYWPLNVGPKPGGEGDESYGLLTNDWQPRWADARLCALRRLVLRPSNSNSPEKGSFRTRSMSLSPSARCSGFPSSPQSPVPASPSNRRSPCWHPENGCNPLAEYEGGPLALALPPWCAPLPGPLCDWPDGPPRKGRLPPARYLWAALQGCDADAGNDAKVVLGSLEEQRLACVKGGYGGFALHHGSAYMRRASAEELRGKLLDTFPGTVLFLPEEVRLCVVWTELQVADEDAAAAPADDALADDVLEVPVDPQAQMEACQSACLREGFGGFESLRGQIGLARLVPRTEAERLLRARSSPSRPAPDGPRVPAEEEQVDLSLPVTPRMMRKIHVLEKTLVRIGLEAFPGHDAFPDINSRVLRGASLAECRQRCLEEGFGGFAVFRGDAYFRTASGPVLRRYLSPSFPETTFYILTAEEVPAAAKAQSRAEVLRALLPSLWSPDEPRDRDRMRQCCRTVQVAPDLVIPAA